MLRLFLRSKLHGLVVTETNLDYEGSLTLDRDLMDAAGLLPNEQIDIYNITSGHRFTTYVIEGRRGSGEACVNGAAAHLAKVGDRIIVACYAALEKHEWTAHQPRVLRVGEGNRVALKPPVPGMW